MKLHWRIEQPGLHQQWVTDEQRDGVPDFLIVKQGLEYRMKMRTSRQWTLHDSLADAKAYAEGI